MWFLIWFQYFKAMGSYVAKANFHWISLVEAMMSKYEQPTKKSCRKKVSMNTLPGNHACISGFSAWVHSKTIFTRFHSQSAVGRGVHKAQFFRRRSGSKISIHKALCHDARIWPISCLACFYAWAHLVIPLALCTLCRLFNFNFFFENFFGVFVWGPAMSPKHLSWGGVLCWAFKKTWL